MLLFCSTDLSSLASNLEAVYIQKVPTLDAFFRQITTFIKLRMAFVFWLPIL